ncbi:MAG: D-glycero-beta-D-manno-heptose-7-phosphate kinase [Candidatus Lernaella stagnicola]|nr:D-glycero-beta-D-manno-heptose-7-phosphate kinase [Candidatus Lernaella stagnicola]
MTLTERKKHLQQIVKRFGDARVLVIGDVMADQYVWGDVERISPEAPVPVVRVKRVGHMLGGAANVADNLRKLGVRVSLCGVIGNDETGAKVRDMLAGVEIERGLLVSKERDTTVKMRVVAHNQQVVRIDTENPETIGGRYRKRIVEAFKAMMPELDAVIVSDYGKGVIDKNLLDELRKAARKYGVRVAVDPKIRNMAHYRAFTTMTPNHHETGEALGIKLTNVDKEIHAAGRRLRRKLRLESLVVTRGEEGMSLFFGDDKIIDIPTMAREVYDVTGAGDTVIATLTCALAVGANLHDAALIANFAAGLVIAEVGAASVSGKQLQAAIRTAKGLT